MRYALLILLCLSITGYMEERSSSPGTVNRVVIACLAGDTWDLRGENEAKLEAMR